MRQRKCRRSWWAVGLLLFCILGTTDVVRAEEVYLEKIWEELDFSEVEDMLEETGEEQISFTELVQDLIQEGVTGFDYAKLFDWVKGIFLSEMKENRELLVEVILLAVGFSILQNFLGAFQKAYVAEICYILVYCILAVLLLKSFLGFREITTQALEQSIDFMQALIPAYCIVMVFAAGTGTSLGFYQTAFAVIYLIQWLFLKILMPAIHCYVLLELCDHFAEKQRFENLTGLLKTAIHWGLKLSAMSVLGINVVQNLISPAKDRIVNGTVSRAAAMIPGVGNAVNGVSTLLLGSGILIKNCVGTAALVLLLFLGMVPMIKLLCMSFFYKLAAAVAEPLTDRRITGCLKGMAEGGVLYLKLLGYSLVLFFLTIALTTAASSYI
jgi:stage III sporulation protein AE